MTGNAFRHDPTLGTVRQSCARSSFGIAARTAFAMRRKSPEQPAHRHRSDLSDGVMSRSAGIRRHRVAEAAANAVPDRLPRHRWNRHAWRCAGNNGQPGVLDRFRSGECRRKAKCQCSFGICDHFRFVRSSAVSLNMKSGGNRCCVDAGCSAAARPPPDKASGTFPAAGSALNAHASHDKQARIKLDTRVRQLPVAGGFGHRIGRLTPLSAAIGKLSDLRARANATPIPNCENA